MKTSFLITAGILMLTGVALGAMGAHTLRGHLSPEHLHAFETGVEYLFYHSLAVIATWLIYRHTGRHILIWAARLFVAGIFLFSGSIFILSTQEYTGLSGVSFLGPVTPLGGLLFMAGWILFITGCTGVKSTR